MTFSRTSTKIAAATFVLGLGLGVTTGVSGAAPSAPTNGGNGAGSSGNCTGPAADRPTSCVSPGGVSGR
jgi:hypothetical protein